MPIDGQYELSVPGGGGGGASAKGYIDPEGLTIANNGTDGDHDLDVTGGFLWVHDPADRTSGNLIEVPDETAAIAIDSTGEGGRINSSALAADTFYEVAILYDSAGDTVGFGVYQDADRPTVSGDLPGSFDQFRAMGSPGKTWWVLTDGSSNILGFTMDEDGWVFWDPATISGFSSLLSLSSPSSQDQTFSDSAQAPPVLHTMQIQHVITQATTGNSVNVGYGHATMSTWDEGQASQVPLDGGRVDNPMMFRNISNNTGHVRISNTSNVAQIFIRNVSYFKATGA